MTRRNDVIWTAIECADDAVGVVSSQFCEPWNPLPEDWEYVEQTLGELTDDEVDLFVGAYRDELRRSDKFVGGVRVAA